MDTKSSPLLAKLGKSEQRHIKLSETFTSVYEVAGSTVRL